ncbi:MAG TPA: heme-copper oxidase subunit III, partial [Aquificaceae bacterium]|nr:heme-copper oxidase subunit III [Aquificaceae bacterium]
MAQEVHHHHLGEHEYSYWPLPVGLAVLLVPLTFIALMVWQKPMLALIFGGVSLVLFVIGIAGWINEFFSKGHEEGL